MQQIIAEVGATAATFAKMTLGEEVLADWLKMDKDQIGALRNDSIVA